MSRLARALWIEMTIWHPKQWQRTVEARESVVD